MQDENKDANNATTTPPKMPVVVTTGSSASPVSPDGLESPKKSGFFSLRAPTQGFMNTLLGVNAVVVLLPTLFYLYIYTLVKSGASGTEFIAWPLLFVAPFFLATIAANLITIPLYLLRSKPNATYTTLTVIALLFSLFVMVGGIYSFANRKTDTYSSSAASSSSTTNSFSDDYKSITTDKALQLMSDCKVDNLIGYNGDITLVHENAKEGVERAEKYPTGISAYIGKPDQPTLIYASKAQTTELVAAARVDRDKCTTQKELKIYLDNTAELRASDGSWQTVTAP